MSECQATENVTAPSNKGHPRCSFSNESFAEAQEKLLALERDAETAQSEDRLQSGAANIKDLVRRGVAVRKLVVNEWKTGLYGKTLVTFGPWMKGIEVPANSLANGIYFNPKTCMFSSGFSTQVISLVFMHLVLMFPTKLLRSPLVL